MFFSGSKALLTILATRYVEINNSYLLENCRAYYQHTNIKGKEKEKPQTLNKFHFRTIKQNLKALKVTLMDNIHLDKEKEFLGLT